jgi:hypothetical protein
VGFCVQKGALADAVPARASAATKTASGATRREIIENKRRRLPGTT